MTVRSRLGSLLWCVPVALAGLLLLPLWLAFGVQWGADRIVRRVAAAADRRSLRLRSVKWRWGADRIVRRVAAAADRRSLRLRSVKWRRTTRRFRWLIAVIAVALIIAAGTVVAGVLLSGSYSDPTRRLAAWTVILASATLVVAILGLPVVLYQLATVRQDLDRVTRAGDFERGLNDLMLPGIDLLERFHQHDDDDMRAEMTGWIEVVAQYIRDKTSNEIEERLFRLEGQGFQPRDQLERKILQLRDKLIPKVRAGYW